MSNGQQMNMYRTIRTGTGCITDKPNTERTSSGRVQDSTKVYLRSVRDNFSPGSTGSLIQVCLLVMLGPTRVTNSSKISGCMRIKLQKATGSSRCNWSYIPNSLLLSNLSHDLDHYRLRWPPRRIRLLWVRYWWRSIWTLYICISACSKAALNCRENLGCWLCWKTLWIWFGNFKEPFYIPWDYQFCRWSVPSPVVILQVFYISLFCPRFFFVKRSFNVRFMRGVYVQVPSSDWTTYDPRTSNEWIANNNRRYIWQNGHAQEN